MMDELNRVYRGRAERFGKESKHCGRRYNRLAIVRLLVFAGGVFLIVYFSTLHVLLGFLAASVFIAGFYRLIRNHQAIQERGGHLGILAAINAREAAMLNDPFADRDPEWPAIYEGAAFAEPQHPYSTDLDLFGPHSFFGYANRCTTMLGSGRLAVMLKAGATAAEINRRQEAVAELAGKTDWRQDLEAIGHGTEDSGEHTALLRLWLEDSPWASKLPWLSAAMIVNPFLVMAGLAGWLMGWLAWPLALLTALPAILILRNSKEKVDRTHLRTTHAERILSQYARLIFHLEGGSWSSPLMRDLTAVFHAGRLPASKHLRTLSYLIGQLNVRYNFFAFLLNLTGLWDLYWVRRLENWREAHRGELLNWFDALAEAEAMNSLGTLRYNNPQWVFPEIHKGDYLEGKELAHPLLAVGIRVPNDLAMPVEGHIKLITGSNMAGKSTFLRTVGLNIVLAMAGSSVCARSFRLPLLRVYSSMRTQDALHESTSSFYAELKRLHQIIEAVESRERSEPQVFLLLDEILKGTNSVDRHAGSRALIRQFILSRGAGLIATHDLELGEMAASYQGAMENLRMEVDIRDGELFFDYQLQAGVSSSFNATLLMQQMGIRLDPADRDVAGETK